MEMKEIQSSPINNKNNFDSIDININDKLKNIKKDVTIIFKNVSYHLIKNKKKLSILDNINGTVAPGELVGVFGPSGSGKTTLLDILANRKEIGQTSGCVLINGEPFDNEYKRLCAYVTQEDNLLPTLTVRETLRFYADLRLPTTYSNEGKESRINWVLEKIGLLHRADSKIGGVLPGGILLRGLSGGEKRRVNIGCGLVTMPSIIILDEPTSGLDAACAMSVMETLVKLTKNNDVTIICSIHQPRSEIYHLFTKVLVLASGRLIYYGSEPVNHFIDLGIPFPEQTNPADYIIDAVSKLDQIDDIANNLVQKYTFEIEKYLEEYKAKHMNKEQPESKSNKVHQRYNISLFHQFSVLYRRHLFDLIRNPYFLCIRFFAGILIGLLFGLCFYKLKNDIKASESKASLIFFLIILCSLKPFCTVGLFISKRQQFNAERAMKLYHTLPYFLSLIAIELCASLVSVLSCIPIIYWMCGLNSEPHIFFNSIIIISVCYITNTFLLLLISTITLNIDITFSIAAAIVVSNQLFAGFFVKPDAMRPMLSWIRHVNHLFYTFRALMINEFRGTVIQCNPEDPSFFYETYCPTSDDFLNYFDMNSNHSVSQDTGCIIAFSCIYFVLIYLSLYFLHREKR